jgi:Cu-processing system permease protein
MNAILTIARLTFQEAVRRRIMAAALVLGILFLVVYGLGVNAIVTSILAEGNNSVQEIREVVHMLFSAGMYVVNFLLIMMTVLTSVDTLSGEVLSGTIHTIAAKPLRRSEIVLGKWLGFLTMFALYFILMAGGVTLIIRVVGNYQPPQLLTGTLLIALNMILLLSLSFLGGTRFSTLANGTLLFGLYGVSFVGGWVEQIGSLFSNQTAINLGIVSSLILPSEALWRRAIYEMRSPLTSLIGISPFSVGDVVPSPLFVGYAVIYATLALLLAIRLFSQRDL